MKKIYYIIIFLIINFGGLAIGNWFMGDAVNGEWYTNINKAPWTPPGWVFGAAWSTIMLCFSYYMAKLFILGDKKKVIVHFSIQFFLNVIWNYIFFNKHLIALGLVCILSLTFVVSIFMFNYKKTMGYTTLCILPYWVWLLIASSLNAYILIYN